MLSAMRLHRRMKIRVPGGLVVFPAQAGMNRQRWHPSSEASDHRVFPAQAGMNRIQDIQHRFNAGIACSPHRRG